MSNRANHILLPAGISLRAGGNMHIDRTLHARNILVPPRSCFYVDCRVASSGNGRTWGTAFKTIQEAIAASNAEIDWAETPWNVDNWIFIAQGTYAEALTPAYSCNIVGLGVLGTDGAVEVHPASGSALAGTGLDLTLYNIRFETETAVPVLDFGVCNNVIIENCEIVSGIAGLATHGISTENASYLKVYNCHFAHGASNGLSHGIYAAGGSDKYFHNCRVEGNYFQGVRSAGTGIYIADNCTASGALIRDNTIVIAGAAIGIYDGHGGALIVNNDISVGASGDAISTAGGASRTIRNHVVVNGSGAIEVTGS